MFFLFYFFNETQYLLSVSFITGQTQVAVEGLKVSAPGESFLLHVGFYDDGHSEVVAVRVQFEVIGIVNYPLVFFLVGFHYL